MKILVIIAVILGVILGIKKHKRTDQPRIKDKTKETIIYDDSLHHETGKTIEETGDNIDCVEADLE